MDLNSVLTDMGLVDAFSTSLSQIAPVEPADCSSTCTPGCSGGCDPGCAGGCTTTKQSS